MKCGDERVIKEDCSTVKTAQRERESCHFSLPHSLPSLSHTLGPCAGVVSRADAESNGARESKRREGLEGERHKEGVKQRERASSGEP